MSETAGDPIGGVTARAYRVPTDGPEADGTFAWDSTTLVVVTVQAGGHSGLGYTYADACVASLASTVLAEAIRGKSSFDIPACWNAMQRAVRNLGRSGLAAC